MTDDTKSLAERLDAVVRAVPGVSVLYSATPAIVTSVRQIGTIGSSAALVSVRTHGDGVEIVCNIGVLASIQGPKTAADVSAAVLDSLPPGTDAKVHVRISRIVG